MILFQLFILKKESFLCWCQKYKTKKTASEMPLGKQQNLIFSLMSRPQKDIKETFARKNSTLKLPKMLDCDMMASSGTLAIDTDSSIISL